MRIEEMLHSMIDAEASDIFIVAGLPLSYEAHGQIRRVDDHPLRPAETRELVASVYATADREFSIMDANGNHDDDFSFSIGGIGRFRANAFRQRGSYSVVIRVIPFGLPDPVEYGIPEEVLSLSSLPRGLVLVTGPAGSGKTTTLACMVDRINHERSGHIITMEDPIEYVHHHAGCIVTQREIPTDVATYGEALRSALREAPDVVLLGEMRDLDTIRTTMTAAEMAQLIFSTLHTTSASGTINRIVDMFPASQQRQIRIQLSMVLQAIVCQQLVPSVDGRLIPAFEIMRTTPAIRNLIRDEKAYQIDSVIASQSASGMRTMNQSLCEMVRSGSITVDTALRSSTHVEVLERKLTDERLM